MQTMELVENIVNYVPISTENETTEIVIDMSEAKYKFPDGTGEIWWHRADGEVYLLESVTEENGLLKATLTDVDLEPSGLAEVEGWWLDGTRLKKSPTYKIGIHQSFTTAAAIKAAKDRELDLLAQVEELKQAYEETYDAINQARASAQAAQAAAEQAEDGAVAAQEAAEAAAEQAGTYKDDAAESASQAQTYATQALGHATVAQTERNDAQRAAEEAAQSAEDLQAAVDAAHASIAAAQSYADLSLQHAQTSGSYADQYLEELQMARDARREAQVAAGLAVDAKNAANGYMNTASGAATAAQTAQRECEDIADRLTEQIAVLDADIEYVDDYRDEAAASAQEAAGYAQSIHDSADACTAAAQECNDILTEMRSMGAVSQEWIMDYVAQALAGEPELKN